MISLGKKILLIIICIISVLCVAACSETSESVDSEANSDIETITITKDSIGKMLYDNNGVTVKIEDLKKEDFEDLDGSSTSTEYNIYVYGENNSEEEEPVNITFDSPTINGYSIDSNCMLRLDKGTREDTRIGVKVNNHEDVGELEKIGEWSEIKGDIIIYFGDSYYPDYVERIHVVMKKESFE